MKHISRLFILLLFLLLLFLAAFSYAEGLSVVLCIGDGMGEEQIKAAGYFMTGDEAFPVVGDFPVKSMMSTCSAGGGVTDSASSATAMATGVKVKNRTISMAVPGNGEDLETVLEYCKGLGMSTGVVTTCFVTHATPADSR